VSNSPDHELLAQLDDEQKHISVTDPDTRGIRSRRWKVS
jgi:hypothetical protein